MSLIASVCIYFGSGETYKQYGIFGVSIILGVSSTTMLITSLAITSDLIGQNTVSISSFFTFLYDSLFDFYRQVERLSLVQWVLWTNSPMD